MKEQSDQPSTSNTLDKARGILWGAVLGDVIGAFLQFNRGIDDNKIKQAFLIKGGGMHKLQPGQPTDDSQLTYSISKGLLRGKSQLNLNYIAEQMGNWFLSKPIDVGSTIRKSIPKACNMKVHQAHLCRKGAKQNSKQSQSNGTLMAITPLAIWCWNLGVGDVVRVVREFTILVHPNTMVVYCNTFYVLMITYFLKNPNQPISTSKLNSYKYAKTSLFPPQQPQQPTPQQKQFLQWLAQLQHYLPPSQSSSQNLEKQLLQKLSPIKKSGWVRIAFTYAIYYLFKCNSFKDGIFNILALKGDTDTNGCIGGGLMGGVYGMGEIEKEMGKQIEIIQGWRPKNVKRPDWLVPGIVVEKIAKNLLQISPKQLKIIGGSDQK